MSQRGLKLNNNETVKAARFLNSHAMTCAEARAKGVYVWETAGSGIGVAITLECACGAKQDITDYASW